MLKTINQVKALIRVTPINERLDLLTDITLEVGNEAITEFCETYRWVLCKKDREKQLGDMVKIKALADRAIKESSNEVDEPESFSGQHE